jgi:uncharacterized protein (DUF362 family)
MAKSFADRLGGGGRRVGLASLAALALLTALAPLGCRKSSPPTGAGASVTQDGASSAVATSPPPVANPPAGADVVSHASDGPWGEGDAGANAQVAPASGRVVTVAKPFWGGDGHPRAPVFVARGDDAEDLIARALDGLAVKVPTDRPAVLKVNLGGFDRMKPGKPDNGVTGRVTDPAIVRAVVRWLRAHDVKDIVVADARSAPASEWPALLELAGYSPMLAELGVAFVDLNHYGDGDLRPPPWLIKAPWAKALAGELVLSAVLVDPDPAKRPYLIDIAKLKAHRFAVMTLSIKNLMGAVMMLGDAAAPAWQRRWRMHRELSPWLAAWKQSKRDDREVYRAALASFSERLADLYGVLTPDLAIVAGLPAMQGDGFAQVVPFGGAGIVIASENPCYADWTAARFFGWSDSPELERELGVRAPPAILAVATRYFGGPEALAKIDVRGDPFLPAPGAAAWFKAMAPFQLGSAPAPAPPQGPAPAEPPPPPAKAP